MTKEHLFAAMIGAGLIALPLACGPVNNNPTHDPRTGEQLATRVLPYRDERRGVTCWVYINGDRSAVSISCLPDSALKAARP